jgi:hypothetical protein
VTTTVLATAPSTTLLGSTSGAAHPSPTSSVIMIAKPNMAPVVAKSL